STTSGRRVAWRRAEGPAQSARHPPRVAGATARARSRLPSPGQEARPSRTSGSVTRASGPRNGLPSPHAPAAPDAGCRLDEPPAPVQDLEPGLWSGGSGSHDEGVAHDGDRKRLSVVALGQSRRWGRPAQRVILVRARVLWIVCVTDVDPDECIT